MALKLSVQQASIGHARNVAALFAKAPVIKEVLAQNKIVVIRVKQENYHIIKDADAHFENRKPDLEGILNLNSDFYAEDRSGKKYRYQVRI